MKQLLMLSLILVMWGGYKFTLQAEDILEKRIYRTDQIVEIVIFLVVLFVICLNVAKRVILGRALFPKQLLRGLSFYVLLFYLMSLASSVFSYYPSYSLFRASQYLITIVLIGYILEEVIAYKAIVKTIFYFGFINLIYVAAGFFFFPQVVMGAEGRLAGGGIFKYDGGVVPFTVCILSLCYYFTSKRRAWKFINAGIFSFALLFLFLYQTRNVLYQFPFYFLFIIFCYRKMSIRTFMIILIAIAIYVALAYLGFSFSEIYTRREGFFFESRLITWEVIFQNLDQIPPWGFGFLGTPAFLFPLKEMLESSHILITADPHNYFLAAYTDLGILGFLYSIAFMFLLLRLLIKRYGQMKIIPQDILLPGLISLILQGVVSSFFTNFLIEPISFATVMTIACLLLLVKADPSAQRYRISNSRYRKGFGNPY